MDLHVFPQGAGVCVGFVAHFAQIWFVRRVYVHVFLAVTAICKSSVAALKFTLERFFTGVCPLVNFQIFRAREHFATAWERTRERLLPRVHSDVIDQFVFGFERFPLSCAVLPEADVVRLLRSPHVLYR